MTDNGNVDKATNNQWLSNCSRKGYLVGFILATQEQSILRRVYQSRISKNGDDHKYRLCKNSKETVDHIISGCSIIKNTEYLQRHDRVAKHIHWTLYKHYQIPQSGVWYEYTPEAEVERKSVIVLRGFSVHPDREIDANRIDIANKDFKKQTCNMLNVTVYDDKNISLKKFDRLFRYKYL